MTIAQQLKIKDFPFAIKDKNNNLIYFETSNGYWEKREWDTNDYLIYFETCKGYWAKRQYDANGNVIYYEDSHKYWVKREWDTNGNVIYSENSDGVIEDKRPKNEIQKAIDLLTKEGLLVDGKILKN